MNNEYKKLHVESTQKALKTRRVVAISGARQTGKTTLQLYRLNNRVLQQ